MEEIYAIAKGERKELPLRKICQNTGQKNPYPGMFYALCKYNITSTTEIRRFPNAVNCLRKVCIRNYSSPYFPAFGLNKERYGVSFRIQFSCGKIRTKITPNTTTFYAVVFFRIRTKYGKIQTRKNSLFGHF